MITYLIVYFTAMSLLFKYFVNSPQKRKALPYDLNEKLEWYLRIDPDK